MVTEEQVQQLYLMSVSLFSSLYIHLQAGRFPTQRLREGPISLVASLALDSSLDPYLCPSVCICSFVFYHLPALGFSSPTPQPPVFIPSHAFQRMPPPLSPEATSAVSQGEPPPALPWNTLVGSRACSWLRPGTKSMRSGSLPPPPKHLCHTCQGALHCFRRLIYFIFFFNVGRSLVSFLLFCCNCGKYPCPLPPVFQ